ncbi:MAG: hypothetical protein GX580_11200 [Candidatus Hydrogenedens sp.]|nr:hypothetical protein [Candidatus Hydrogenedentota bacterium]NLF58193.1 hypothetical protein [Candidatus Hydrogenedens sp.]
MNRMTIAALLTVLAALSAAAAPTVEPASVVFDKTGMSATLRVLDDGVPLPAGEITGFRLMVGGSDYRHMFRMSKADGAVTLTPSATVEVGSYDLAITTARGDAWAKVYTPLGDQQTSLQNLAQRLNIPLEDLKRQIGMTRDLPQSRIELSLPPVYYVGLTFHLEMPGGGAARRVWKLNGEVVREGADATSITHVFKEPGPCLLEYAEYLDGRRVAEVGELIEVVGEPPLPVNVAARTTLTLNSPEGYAKYSWTLDGQMVSADPAFVRAFEEPGEHTVVLLAESPVSGQSGEFRRIVHKITVTP